MQCDKTNFQNKLQVNIIENMDPIPSNIPPPAPCFLNSHHFCNTQQQEDKASLLISQGW